ncbi:hypothetical protein AHAS_Ahas04G0119500 [Arachis hypogaea]
MSRPSFASSSCWRATPDLPSGTPEFTGPLIPLLEKTTSVPRHETGMSRPSFAMWDFLSWRATPSIPSGTPSFCIVSLFTGVPHLVAQVARPFNCGSYRLGMPRLGSQVARPSELWGWRATPSTQSGTL